MKKIEGFQNAKDDLAFTSYFMRAWTTALAFNAFKSVYV